MTIRVFIQNEVGSCRKNHHDEKSLQYRHSETIPHAYPFPYGFVIGTDSGDGGNVELDETVSITKDIEEALTQHGVDGFHGGAERVSVGRFLVAVTRWPTLPLIWNRRNLLLLHPDFGVRAERSAPN